MRIVPLTDDHAAAIVAWRYPPPYDCYDMKDCEPAFLTDPANGYFALVDQAGSLAGFRLFGADGRVPGGSYDSSALDTGGGLRPDLTGQGLGRLAIGTGLAFGRERFAPAAFRLTVAEFNSRALRVVRDLGFADIGQFKASADGRSYLILVRPES